MRFVLPEFLKFRVQENMCIVLPSTIALRAHVFGQFKRPSENGTES